MINHGDVQGGEGGATKELQGHTGKTIAYL